MDEPLFGEQKKQAQIGQYIVGLTVTIFTLFSLAVGIFFGIKHPRDFTLVGTLALVFMSTALLVRWWKDRDDAIHPKFKWLVFLLILSTLACGVTVNVFVWEKIIPQPVCNGLYMTGDKKCFKWPDTGACQTTDCLQVDYVGFNIMCTNCTVPCTNGTMEEMDSFEPEKDIYEFKLPVIDNN
ncbi:hypothetical protein SAMD00019534_098760 [Acytostelium subglobosum LB1]|uniref:hypothetical protein n=1 Tax=Acytostelium subglobosum LB1 TaxID=1410327 RepID=UPI000644A716|nr:hypothetical protein SAMD00019534_098760 [Acytostelium subglobosum LB1]GAM26701.1 hypothetical protein SAMD00019534_098760 [Acytostelium subglobosum LB1]|eukprot:XP_012750362.1 hypothetical protein SAMD00019534_098760 [Acytostelium subglobosum LB1]